MLSQSYGMYSTSFSLKRVLEMHVARSNVCSSSVVQVCTSKYQIMWPTLTLGAEVTSDLLHLWDPITTSAYSFGEVHIYSPCVPWHQGFREDCRVWKMFAGSITTFFAQNANFSGVVGVVKFCWYTWGLGLEISLVWSFVETLLWVNFNNSIKHNRASMSFIWTSTAWNYYFDRIFEFPQQTGGPGNKANLLLLTNRL